VRQLRAVRPPAAGTDATWTGPRGDMSKVLILLNARLCKVLLTQFLLTLRTVWRIHFDMLVEMGKRPRG
jgi:hypothetical protein